jgi:hypothetical protein
MARTLPANADLPQLCTQARQLRRAVADGNPSALARARDVRPDAEPARFTLRDAQLVLAREYGFDGWHELATKLGTGNVNQRDLHRWFGVELNNGAAEALARGHAATGDLAAAPGTWPPRGS